MALVVMEVVLLVVAVGVHGDGGVSSSNGGGVSSSNGTGGGGTITP